MSTAFVTLLAVDTGVVVIVVAVVVGLIVLFVSLSMRGRQQRRATRERDLADSAPPSREQDTS